MDIVSQNGFVLLSSNASMTRYSYRGYRIEYYEITGNYFHKGRWIGDGPEQAKKTLDVWADHLPDE